MRGISKTGFLACFACGLAAPAWAQPAAAVANEEPELRNGQLYFPPGAAIPRYLTGSERAYLQQNPLFAARDANPPTGPVHCAAEYEPMQAIFLSWNGSSSWLGIVAAMANRITRFGDAEAWVVVNNAATQTSAATQLSAAGVDMTKVRFFQRTLDTIWIRDYGPRYIFQGDCRAIVDHTYNRPRPNDDAFCVWAGQQLHQPVYAIPLIHGGGNYHLDATGLSYATRLINNENPGLTEPQIISHWLNYQNCNTHLFTPFPTNIDSTQHLDMWVEVIGDRTVMVSDWPNNAGSTQDVICDQAADYFASQGYTVYRLPAFSVTGVHYTYTNVVICNNIVLVPMYTNATVQPSNAVALATWQAAMPGKTIYQVNCQSIVTAAGVMHCIAMHVPRPRGGANPTAYMVNLNAGETIAPGTPFGLRWITDDDRAVTTVDLLLSTDGGATYPAIIATGLPVTATSFDWTTPDGYFPHCRLKAVAHDADGNSGFDVTDADFSIGSCPPDFNTDGFVDFFDLDAFIECFEGGACPPGKTADYNADGFVDFFDADAFVADFEMGC